MIRKIEYTDRHELIFLDQTLLPHRKKFIRTTDYKVVAEAIINLKIRGAPLIGIAAAYGIVLGIHNPLPKNGKNFQARFYKLAETFRKARPTARNLFYSIDRLERVFAEVQESQPEAIASQLLYEADRIYDEDIEMCNRIGINGADLINEEMNILTHCNAGELATGGIGSALGIIYTAQRIGKKVFVYVDETRPLMQGSRLTVFELQENNIPCELIIDSMAANLMREGMIDCVITGADRIAPNGDVVNKIGSYSLAVNCFYHKVPFYVAAPSTTIDFDIQTGDETEIEERNGDEVRKISGNLITTKDTEVLNPAFDLIPNELVSAIVTEYKVLYPPYNLSMLKQVFDTFTQSILNRKK
jgi:methylthioribose-1-phosphate isomerase